MYIEVLKCIRDYGVMELRVCDGIAFSRRRFVSA